MSDRETRSAIAAMEGRSTMATLFVWPNKRSKARNVRLLQQPASLSFLLRDG
jgi:hypothetical protein